MHNAAVNRHLHVLVQVPLFNPSVHLSRSGIPGAVAILCVTF